MLTAGNPAYPITQRGFTAKTRALAAYSLTLYRDSRSRSPRCRSVESVAVSPEAPLPDDGARPWIVTKAGAEQHPDEAGAEQHPDEFST